MVESEVKILTPEGGVMTVTGTVIPPEVDLDDERFGAGGIPILKQLQLLAQWGPLLSLLSPIATASTPRDKAVAVLQALAFAAGRTKTTIDDEVVAHFEAVLKTPEGEALFNWVAALAKVSA